MTAALRIQPELAAEAIPAHPEDWLVALGGPSAIRVPGRAGRRARMVTTLLHGNEPSGARAIHAWLRSGERPAVDAWLVIANVEAALAPPRFQHRMLPGRRDLNRCFLGPHDDPDGALAREILALIREVSPEALIDLHNNSGHNPPYGVGVQREARIFALVSLFAQRFVASDLNLGALMEATRHLPSATIEVGRSGDAAADRVALDGLRRFLCQDDVLKRESRDAPMQVLSMPRRVGVRPGATLAVADGPVDGAELTVALDLDRHNFETLPAGTAIGWVKGEDLPLEVVDEEGCDQADAWFAVEAGRVVARRPLIPIMITTDVRIAMSDCLFYVVRED